MADSMNDILHPRNEDPEFPHAPTGWSRDDAARQAADMGLDPGDDHWEEVRALQEYFARHATGEVHSRELQDALDEKFHVKGGLKYLYKLFPGGPITQGCRMAGLETPAGSGDSGFGSVK